MGSDRFCVICGGPFEKIDRGIVATFYWDVKEIRDDEEIKKLLEKFPYDKYRWLGDLYLITDKNAVITPSYYKNYNSYGGFIINSETILISSMKFSDERDERNEYTRAIVCHRWCYEFIEKTFNYELKYTDVVSYLTDSASRNLFESECYLEMGEYIGQWRNPIGIYDANNSWLLDTDDNRNRARILAIWTPIVYDIKYVKK